MRVYRVVYTARYGGTDSFGNIDLAFRSEEMNKALMNEVDRAISRETNYADGFSIVNVIPMDIVSEEDAKLVNGYNHKEI